jgi:hypothetical protein
MGGQVLALMLLLGAHDPGGLAAPTQNSEAFTQASARALTALLAEKKGMGDVVANVERPLALAVVRRKELLITVSLERPWDVCQREPDRCDVFTRDYLAKTAAAVESSMWRTPPTKEQLRVLVRPSSYLKELGNKPSKPTALPLAGDLWAVIMMDTPASARIVTKDELGPLKLDEQSALKAALANVTAEVGTVGKRARKLPGQSIGYLDPPHYYNCGLVIEPAQWAALARSMKGPLLVSVPSSELVLYADGDGPAAVAAMRAATEKVFKESDRGVSTTILRWTKTGWSFVE